MTSFGARGRASQRGLSLVEVVIAVTVFAMVGQVVMLSLRASEQSHSSVAGNVSVNQSHREATELLCDELRAAERDSITLVDLPSGDRSIEFRTAIAGAGGPQWGVFDRRLDLDEAACHKADWTVRYTIVQGPAGAKRLVRQIRDAGGALQLADDLVADVTTFTVTPAGSVWVVELDTRGSEGRRHEEFDVRTRDV